MTINHTDRARRAWQALISVATQGTTTTYSGLGAQIGIHHRAVRYVLGPIQDYCMEAGLPPLTILVVNGTGRPGKGFIAHESGEPDSGVKKVHSFPWQHEINPFDFSANGLSYNDLLVTLTKAPEESEEVYALVKVRGVQQLLFRDAVREAYAGRCAFTGMTFPDALEACHIVPWEKSNPQQRLDVRNGILLNPLHHKLFDKAYMTLTPEYKIHYWDPEGTKSEYNALEHSLTVALHGTSMHLPRRPDLRPLLEYIRAHNVENEWGLD